MSVLASQEPTSSTVAPGADGAVHTVRVRNSGDTVEEYQISVVGPLSAWSTVSPEQLRLYPGDEGTATVTFTVPRTAEAAAGPTPFGVRVVPRVHPELVDIAEGSVTVAPFAEMRADMVPVTVRARLSARLRPTVENLGNAPLEVRLVGRDDEDLLRFDEQTAPPAVAPGTTGRPVMRVRPRRRKFTGAADRFPFSVTVAPTREAEAAGAQPTQLRGTYVRLPLVPRWLLILLILAILAAIVLGGLNYFRAIDIGLPSRAGPAAPAANPGQDEAPPAQGGGGGGGGGGEAQDPGQGQVQGAVTIVHEGRALTASANEGRAGAPAPVAQEAGQGSANRQRWELARTQSGSVVIVAGIDDGRALDQPDGAGDPLVLGEFDGRQVAATQVWELRDASGGVTIVNSGSGDCLTDTGDGRNVVADRCGDDGSQIWAVDGA